MDEHDRGDGHAVDVVGNAVAIVQRDLKRMLAYSGIAHVGYMMIAMLTVRDDSVAAVAVYTFVYALMNIGAFGVGSLLVKNENDPHTLDDIAGLGFRRPFYGLALALCMFSLSGLPPTAGFISKFYIFRTAIESGHMTVAFVGILASLISVYYYLRVVYYLYMKEAPEAYAVAPAGGVFAAGALMITMVGAGNLGMALADYQGFNSNGFHIVAMLDVDPGKVGRESRLGIPVMHTDHLPDLVRKNNVEIGIIAVSAESAQFVHDALADAGIRASSTSPRSNCACAATSR